jgi:hypothetical protein
MIAADAVNDEPAMNVPELQFRIRQGLQRKRTARAVLRRHFLPPSPGAFCIPPIR